MTFLIKVISKSYILLKMVECFIPVSHIIMHLISLSPFPVTKTLPPYFPMISLVILCDFTTTGKIFSCGFSAIIRDKKILYIL